MSAEILRMLKVPELDLGIMGDELSWLFQDVDCRIGELRIGESVSECTTNWKSYIQLLDDGGPKISSPVEEVWAHAGEVNEWFAYDANTPSNKDIRVVETQRRRKLNTDPKDSIQQDILSNIFDDIWLEIIPVLEPIIECFLDDPAMSRDAVMDPKQRNHELGDIESDALTLLETENLLSAMTIRQVALQKRDSSARIRTTHDVAGFMHVLPSESSGLSFSRPTSARPRSAARPTSARPLSARINVDVYQRMQSASSKIAQNSKRLNQCGTSVVAAFIDVIKRHERYGIRNQSGMESSRPSTAIPGSATAKRLPPIRNTNVQDGSLLDYPPALLTHHSSSHSSIPAPSTTKDAGASIAQAPTASTASGGTSNAGTSNQKGSGRHVIFESGDGRTGGAGSSSIARATSPRPASARRAPSAGSGLRSRNSQPNRNQAPLPEPESKFAVSGARLSGKSARSGYHSKGAARRKPP
ncbi:hypothetical protein BJ742DRAFT_770908 [Cladochytrium replicatum]|nr:hypothetical protein BJ742DRAFT_770908 [Cladochytrium replicatum]